MKYVSSEYISGPDLTLKKKSNAIAYQLVQETVAAGSVWFAYELAGSNRADILTKNLPQPPTRQIISYIYY
jgi:hypothetical protein